MKISSRIRSTIYFAAVLVVVGAAGIIAGRSNSRSGPVLSPPGTQHVLGTDRLGRDVLQRTCSAFLYTVGRSAMALVASVVVGVAICVLSVSHLGGASDRIIIMLAETVRSFPSIVLALLFVSAGVPLVLMLPFMFWVPVWRASRTLLAQQRNRAYVMAARLFGMSPGAALLWEALPNVLPMLVPYGVFIFAELLAVQASLEFLGFGPNLQQACLGLQLAEAMKLGSHAYWVWLPSLVVIIGFVLGSFLSAFRLGSTELALVLE